jgi:hypothetical protein
MFKPVIRSSVGRDGSTSVARFVEQSTLIHEFGHAIGLVNHGMRLTTMHQDTAHGAHCTNDKCTMFWANEGAVSASKFARQYVITGSEILYGAECLADIDALAQKPR